MGGTLVAARSPSSAARHRRRGRRQRLAVHHPQGRQAAAAAAALVPSLPPIGNDIKKPGVDRAGVRPAAGEGGVPAVEAVGAHQRRPRARSPQPLLVLTSRDDHVVETGELRAADERRRLDRQAAGLARGQLPRRHARQRPAGHHRRSRWRSSTRHTSRLRRGGWHGRARARPAVGATGQRPALRRYVAVGDLDPRVADAAARDAARRRASRRTSPRHPAHAAAISSCSSRPGLTDRLYADADRAERAGELLAGDAAAAGPTRPRTTGSPSISEVGAGQQPRRHRLRRRRGVAAGAALAAARPAATTSVAGQRGRRRDAGPGRHGRRRRGARSAGRSGDVDEHFVPPPPPPLPRLRRVTVMSPARRSSPASWCSSPASTAATWSGSRRSRSSAAASR